MLLYYLGVARTFERRYQWVSRKNLAPWTQQALQLCPVEQSPNNFSPEDSPWAYPKSSPRPDRWQAYQVLKISYPISPHVGIPTRDTLLGRVFTNLRHNQFASVLYQKHVSIENLAIFRVVSQYYWRKLITHPLLPQIGEHPPYVCKFLIRSRKSTYSRRTWWQKKGTFICCRLPLYDCIVL